MSLSRPQRLLYGNLLHIRPARLATLLKSALRIRRRIVEVPKRGRFWVDPVSHFGLELMRDDVYEPKLTELLEVLLRPDDTFVDIGGNEGYFSIVASGRVGRGQVHCIEPQSRLQPVLRRNCELNQADNVSLHHLALSSSSETRAIYLHPDTNTGATSFFAEGAHSAKTETVPTQTLDAFFAEQCISLARLVKIDCEGAEKLVMAGAARVFAENRIEFLALEYHPNIIGYDACNDINARLRRAGYRLSRAGTLWVYHLPGLESALSAYPNLSPIDWRENGEIYHQEPYRAVSASG